jgi:O-antigen ligase
MTKYLVYLSLLIWPFGLFMSSSVWGISVLWLDIIVFLIFISSLPMTRKGLKDTPNHARQLVIFLFFATLSLVLSASRLDQSHLMSSFLYLARLVTYSSLIFVRPPALRIRPIAMISFAVFVILALAQYLLSPDMRDFYHLGFDDHYYRLVGSLLDPNFTGLLISVIAVIYAHFGVGGWWLLILPLSLSFSRASYLSFVAGIVYLYHQHSRKLVIAIISILLLGIVISPKPFGEGVNLLRTFSITSRLESQITGLRLFADKPIFGWGYQTLVTSSPAINIDNSFIIILSTTGLLGFFFFVRFLISYFRSLSPHLRSALVMIVVHALFNNSLFMSHILYLFMILSWFDIRVDS